MWQDFLYNYSPAVVTPLGLRNEFSSDDSFWREKDSTSSNRTANNIFIVNGFTRATPPMEFELEKVDNSPESFFTANNSEIGLRSPSPDQDEDGPHPPLTKLKARLTLPKRQFRQKAEDQEVELTLSYGDDGEETVCMTNLHQLLGIVELITEPTRFDTEDENESMENEDFPYFSPRPTSNSSGRSLAEHVSSGRQLHFVRKDLSPMTSNEEVVNPDDIQNDDTDEEEGWQTFDNFPQQRQTLQTPSSSSSDPQGHDVVQSREKPFPCDQCSKAYTQKSHLTRHKRRHDKSVHKQERKEFKCPMCDRAFGIIRDLKEHLNSMHLRIPHPCPHPSCGKIFKWRQSLNKHQRDVHRKK